MRCSSGFLAALVCSVVVHAEDAALSSRELDDDEIDGRRLDMKPYSRLATPDMVFKSYKNAPDVLPNFGSLGARVFGKPDRNTDRYHTLSWDPNKDTVGVEELGSYAGGDILVPTTIQGTGRNGLVAQTSRWPRGIIPFIISGDFSPPQLDLIYSAMRVYHEFTCIRFIPWRGHEPDYISIENNQTGCWASVGRLGGRQVVNLQAPGCLSKIGTPLHELMHSVGFLHEQNRYERDGFVNVIWDNIAEVLKCEIGSKWNC
ncbi:hypothetical protein B566_EDAN011322 [Ephemera danica]|nr:hypothetical protein B566_EDAN011322 [Ephemera danica]